jgi:hypothetical protein
MTLNTLPCSLRKRLACLAPVTFGQQPTLRRAAGATRSPKGSLRPRPPGPHKYTGSGCGLLGVLRPP